MIKLIDSSESFSCNHIYTDHFPGQNRNIIVLMKHFSQDKFAEKVLEKVFSELIKLQLDSISEDKINIILKEFFIEINWRIFSLFSQRPDLERGISLVLAVMESDRIYIVQFGRYFIGKIDQDSSFEEIGRTWDNLSLKAIDDIGLLGSKDTDITVKVNELTLPRNSYLLVVESSEALKLKNLGLNCLSIQEHLNLLKEKDQFGFVLIKRWQQSAHNPSPWIKRRRVNRTATVLLILIILSAAYVYYGRNIIDDLFSRWRFTGKEITRNEIKDQFFRLQEQAQYLLNQLSEQDMNFELIPSQQIHLEADWELTINQNFSLTPCFDYRRIYAGSGNKIYAIGKNKTEIEWQKRLNAQVEVLRLVDANRILVALRDGCLLCLNRDSGELIWTQQHQGFDYEPQLNKFIQISLNQYRQLEDSMIMMHESSKLTLMLVRTGELKAEYSENQDIDFISEYDILDRCIYVVTGKTLKKINIKIIL